MVFTEDGTWISYSGEKTAKGIYGDGKYLGSICNVRKSPKKAIEVYAKNKKLDKEGLERAMDGLVDFVDELKEAA